MAIEVAGSALLPIPQRVAELGRIRLGEKGERGQPVKLKTFRLTSPSKPTLDAAALLYGGKVTPWAGAPDEGQWQLTTAVAELDVLVPRNIRNISQAMELWKGGTCVRRCDLTTVRTPDGDVPCICTAKGLDGADRECDVITRVSVILPRVPGMGVWRLDTGGWFAATTLPATMQLLGSMSTGAFVPAVLRAEQRSKKERLPDGKVQTHRWVQPALDAPGTTIEQLVAASGVAAPLPALAEGERPAPPTAAQVAAQRAEAIKARQVQSATPAPMDDGPWPEGATRTKPDVTGEGTPPVEVVAAPEGSPSSSPAPAAPLTRCESFAEGIGRCSREEGHPGNHRSADQQTWH